MHDLFMGEALDLARQAAAAGEVPVGAVVVAADRVGLPQRTAPSLKFECAICSFGTAMGCLNAAAASAVRVRRPRSSTRS